MGNCNFKKANMDNPNVEEGKQNYKYVPYRKDK